MKKNIKIGIIGTGAGIRTHFPAFMKCDAEIVGIVGKNFDKTQQIAKEKQVKAFKSYKDLCNHKEIDLIVIASPNYLHYEQIRYAISKDKNILAEKPLVLTIEENRKLIALTKKSKNLCIVNHQLRFNQYIKAIKKIIESQKLGYIYYTTIHQQSSSFSRKNMDSSWSFEKNKGGGVRLAMGSHLIDLTKYLFSDREILNVYANSNSVINRRKNETYSKDIDVSSFFTLDMSLDNDSLVRLLSNASSLGNSEFKISLYGSDGELHFDLENKLFLKLIGDSDFKKIEVEGVSQEELENEISIFRSSFKSFAPLIIKAIQSGAQKVTDNDPDFNNSLEVLRVLEASRTSNEKKRSINI